MGVEGCATNGSDGHTDTAYNEARNLKVGMRIEDDQIGIRWRI